MPYYLIVDLASMGPQGSGGGAEAELLTLEGEDGAILPVFTSEDRFWAFVDEYFAEDASFRPSTFPMDPFRLAEIIEPLVGASELGFLVFDPAAVSVGQWSSAEKATPVAHYCRFMSEIRPELIRLIGEGNARLGTAPPESSAYKEVMEWYRPKIERLAKSVGARVDEWWDEHGDQE